MLSVCAVDRFLLEYAKDNTPSSRGESSGTLPIAVPSDVHADGKSVAYQDLLRRIANRHIICDPYRGRGRTEKYRYDLENTCCYIKNQFFRNEFSRGHECDELISLLRDTSDVCDYLKKKERSFPIDADHQYIDIVTKSIAELLVAARIEAVKIVFVHRVTLEVIQDLFDYDLFDLSNYKSHWPALQDKAMAVSFSDKSKIHLTANLNTQEYAAFLFSGRYRHDDINGYAIGLNLSGLKYEQFSEMMRAFNDCWRAKPYALCKNVADEGFRDLWSNVLRAPFENIYEHCKGKAPLSFNWEKWHDRFIVFPSDNEDNLQFIAIVFSTEFKYVFKKDSKTRRIRLERGTCVIRCSTDPQPNNYESIVQLIRSFQSPILPRLKTAELPNIMSDQERTANEHQD